MRQYHEMVFWPILYSWLIHRILSEEKYWNPDWHIKWIGDWPSVSTLVFRPENPPSLFCGNTPPPPSLNTVLLDSERMGPLSSTPSTVGCFPPLVPIAGYGLSTLLLFDTQHRSYTSVVVWNLFCDWNSDWQVSCCRNLRRFKQINNHDIYTTQKLAINSINIGAD